SRSTASSREGGGRRRCPRSRAAPTRSRAAAPSTRASARARGADAGGRGRRSRGGRGRSRGGSDNREPFLPCSLGETHIETHERERIGAALRGLQRRGELERVRAS